MALDPELLQILACPSCKGRLNHHPEPESLSCPACGKAYPVKDGVPDFVSGPSSRP